MTAAEPAEPPGTFLPWDSDFFGFRIGRLKNSRLTADTLRSALAWARAERLRCAYFFADADCPTTLSLAHTGGFKFADVRMELALPLDDAPAFQPAAIFRPALAGELADIEALSRTAHRDTRFFKDDNFPATTAGELYGAWIRRDFKLHHIFVVPSARTAIAGYITCQHDEAAKVGRIGLIAVTAAERRHGLGRVLLTGALQWFRAAGCKEVRVVTQASNIAAQRTYQKLGFRTADTCVTFHRWFEPS